MTAPKPKTATLLITCPDQRGLVAAIADFLFRNHANILHSDQHQDPECGLFLMRVEWDLEGFSVRQEDFAAEFSPIASRFQMTWRLAFSEYRPRVAILVSRYDHCLVDLLYRHKSGELPCDIPLVISNHADTHDITAFYGIPFQSVEVDPQQKVSAEERQLALLRESRIDLVILARYMQVLSPRFVQAYPNRIINIHHSFLPAFLGAKPYHRAFDRGVKLIGATSHYVTEALDDGPIIEQDVIRVSHRDTVADLIQKGRDLEKIVLSRAVRWHLENRIVVYGNKTVIFD